MIVLGQDPCFVDWVNDQLGVEFSAHDVRTVASVDERRDRIIAVVVYSRFSEHGCEMTIASSSPRWCSRRFLKAAFTYPFIQCGYRRVLFVTTPSNTSTIDLLDRLGAKREGCLREWFGDEDGIIYGLLRTEAQKWITR